MIPKIIHYCWFGDNPLPRMAKKCIRSWKKYFPDYEIREWNESNFDVNIISYTAEAYKMKKYAFVSDYVRFWVLYQYGGIYFDTDVEVIKPMDEIINRGPFMGCEKASKMGAPSDSLGVAPGLGLGAPSGLRLYKEILDMYRPLCFLNADGSLNMITVVQYVTGLLCKKGLRNMDDIQYVAGVYIYPKEYFSPIDFSTMHPCITPNTYTIHYFVSSWKKVNWKRKVKPHVPECLIRLSQRMRKLFQDNSN